MNSNKENLQWSTRRLRAKENVVWLYRSRTLGRARSTSSARVSERLRASRYCTASRCFVSMLLASSIPFISFISPYYFYFVYFVSFISLLSFYLPFIVHRTRCSFGARRASSSFDLERCITGFVAIRRDSYTRADPSLAYSLINYALTF